MNLIKTPIDFIKLGKTQNNVLLGDWCLRDEQDVLSTRNSFDIVPYHWDSRDKYYHDYLYLEQIYEKILTCLSHELNIIHALNQDVRYWRIIIGPWLRFFIDAVFDRYETVRAAMVLGDEIRSTIFSYNLDDWCPTDFSEFWNDLLSDEWNEVIFSECLLVQDIPIDFSRKKIYRNETIRPKKWNFANILKKSSLRTINQYSKIVGPWQRGAIFIGAYIPISKLAKLQLKLGQLPYVRAPVITLDRLQKDETQRDGICRSPISNAKFESLLGRLVRSLMPKVYLEGFSDFKKRVVSSLPSNPQSIFTANSYNGDDVFKVWAAEKTAQGVPLIIGQHGGNFGVGFSNQSEKHQIKIADKFVSWGWVSASEHNITRLPSLQLSGKNPIFTNPNGGILHVFSAPARYFYQHFSVPVAGQTLDYLENQITFLNSLEKKYLQKVRIRLDLSGKNSGWNIPDILKDFGFHENIDKKNNSIINTLQSCRLCVCTQNTTVFLETLSLNFPTIIFWDASHYEIRPDAKPFFDLLENAGILYLCPKKAAEQVNRITDSVGDWWLQDSIQSARDKFCKQYAFSSDDWLNEWSHFFKEL